MPAQIETDRLAALILAEGKTADSPFLPIHLGLLTKSTMACPSRSSDVPIWAMAEVWL
jgi:hypothetical protein